MGARGFLLSPERPKELRTFKKKEKSNWTFAYFCLRLPWWLRWKSVCLHGGRPGFDPWVRKMPWRRKWQPIPVLLSGKFHGWRSLVGYSPWGLKEFDTTERLHFLSLFCSQPFIIILVCCERSVGIGTFLPG